jgi:hypothetical protein
MSSAIYPDPPRLVTAVCGHGEQQRLSNARLRLTFYNAPVAYCGPARPGSAFQQSAVSGLLPRARARRGVSLQDYLGHRRSPRPCATPPSRRTASRGSGGTEGPTRGQNKKGACRTKLHRERRRRWRLGWSRRGSGDGAVAVQQVLFPGHSLARARRGVWSRQAERRGVRGLGAL